MVKRFNGFYWVDVGSPILSTDTTGFQSLAFYRKKLYLAYRDYSNSGKATVMKGYAIRTRAVRSKGLYDGRILESSEFSGLGGSLDRDHFIFVGDDALDRQYRAILSFYTGGIPDNAIITGVFLKVKRKGLVGGDPFFSKHGDMFVDIRWAPFSKNKALQLTDFQFTPSMYKAGVFNKRVQSGNWYDVTMRGASYKYINKKNVTQFRLRFSTGDDDDHLADYLKLLSGDYSNPAYRPLLIIDYYVP